MDEIKSRIDTLHVAITEVRDRVRQIAQAASGLHSIDGQPMAVDVLMLGSTIAGGCSFIEAGLAGQLQLLEAVATNRAREVDRQQTTLC